MRTSYAREWVWLCLALQLLGYVIDVLWHGWLRAGVEPATVGEMARHLATVHLVLYVGAIAVVVSLAMLVVRERSTSSAGIALPIALGAAVLSASGEAWHAYSHLQMDTSHAPIAGSLSFLGFLTAVVAMSQSSGRRDAAAPRAGRRAV
jgi:hypothetical protein